MRIDREKILLSSDDVLLEFTESPNFLAKMAGVKKGNIKFSLDQKGLEDSLIFLTLSLRNEAEHDAKKMINLLDLVTGLDKKKARKIAVFLSGFALGKGWDVNMHPETFFGFAISEFKAISDTEWLWLIKVLSEI